MGDRVLLCARQRLAARAAYGAGCEPWPSCCPVGLRPAGVGRRVVGLRAPQRPAAEDSSGDCAHGDSEPGVPMPHGRPPLEPDNELLLSLFLESLETNPQRWPRT